MRFWTWMIAVVAAATALAGCGAEHRSADPAPRATPVAPAPRLAAAAPQTSTRTSVDLPATPSLRRPAELAAQLGQAERAIRRPHAAEADVRRAAWFEQLAAHALGRAPEGRVRAVLRRLHGPGARTIRADVEAARQLTSLTAPARRLPAWRVARPPSRSTLLGYYRDAEKATGVPWEYLAAVNLVETRMGRVRGVSSAGAQGPMQFMPSTWKMYGAGGDIHRPKDAILAAARLLRANGAPRHMAGALWHYNQSDRYVRAVTEYATAMRHSPSAYTGYWHWQVLYRQRSGTFVLPAGYPTVPAHRLALR